MALQSSNDVQALGYRLDWNDPSWESAEPPCLRFSNLPEADEDEEEEAATAEPVSKGPVFMPVGFLNQNQEYIPFMDLPTEQAAVYLEPAILQKVVMNPTAYEPQKKEPDHAWSPIRSHADWEGLGEKRGVLPSNSGSSWRSSRTRDDWETTRRSWRQQNYNNSWDNQARQWDKPWGM